MLNFKYFAKSSSTDFLDYFEMLEYNLAYDNNWHTPKFFRILFHDGNGNLDSK